MVDPRLNAIPAKTSAPSSVRGGSQAFGDRAGVPGQPWPADVFRSLDGGRSPGSLDHRRRTAGVIDEFQQSFAMLAGAVHEDLSA
jgi:hypothetical protein